MGNSNCGCSRKVGGKRVKRGGMGCSKTRKHKPHMKKRKKKSKSKKGGCNSCGCRLMSGGYKYDRRSSVEAVKRLKKRVSKNTKSKSKSKSKHSKSRKNVSIKRNGRK